MKKKRKLPFEYLESSTMAQSWSSLSIETSYCVHSMNVSKILLYLTTDNTPVQFIPSALFTIFELYTRETLPCEYNSCEKKKYLLSL